MIFSHNTTHTDLKQALYALAGQYGAVVDIVARSTLRTKGQAFVVFRDVSSAAAALRALHGRDLFDKPMRVQYARDRSDAALRTADEGTSAAAAAAIAERVRIRQQRREQLRKQQQSAKRKAARKRPLPSATAAAATATAAVAAPNNMLFVENLPAGYTEDALRALFGQIGGFCEAKMVPARQGLAFVEYDTPVSAGTALVRLNGLKVDPDHPIRVTFAKR